MPNQATNQQNDDDNSNNNWNQTEKKREKKSCDRVSLCVYAHTAFNKLNTRNHYFYFVEAQQECRFFEREEEIQSEQREKFSAHCNHYWFLFFSSYFKTETHGIPMHKDVQLHDDSVSIFVQQCILSVHKEQRICSRFVQMNTVNVRNIYLLS